MTASYLVGASATITSPTFKVGSTPTDPATLVLVVTKGDGTSTSYAVGTLTHVSTGVYTKTVTVDVEGIWTYLFTATAVDNTNAGGALTVLAGYCTVAQAKSWLTIKDALDDTEIAQTAAAVSRVIDADCGWHFYQTTEARTFVADSRYLLDLHNVQEARSVIASASGITIKTDANGDGTFETTWQTADFQLLPANAPTSQPEPWPWRSVRAVGAQTFPLPYTALLARRDRVQITATWGWPQVPAAVVQACKLQTARVLNRRYSPQGVAAFGDLGPISVKNLDPDVTHMLNGVRDGDNVVVFA